MSEERPTSSSNGRNGLITKILDRLLSYADRPWRAIFVLILVVLIGFGYLAWHERQALLKLLERRSSEEHLSADLGAVISTLFYTTTADAVGIWSVDLRTATTEFVVGRRRDLTEWRIMPKTLRAFTETSNPQVTAHLLRGESTCLEPPSMHFPVAEALTQDGMKSACLVPEPPSRTSLLIAVLILAWREKPPQSVSDAAVSAVLRETAKIVTH